MIPFEHTTYHTRLILKKLITLFKKQYNIHVLQANNIGRGLRTALAYSFTEMWSRYGPVAVQSRSGSNAPACRRRANSLRRIPCQMTRFRRARHYRTDRRQDYPDKIWFEQIKKGEQIQIAKHSRHRRLLEDWRQPASQRKSCSPRRDLHGPRRRCKDSGWQWVVRRIVGLLRRHQPAIEDKLIVVLSSSLLTW